MKYAIASIALLASPVAFAQDFSNGTSPYVHVERNKASSSIQAEIGTRDLLGPLTRSNPQTIPNIGDTGGISVDASTTMNCGQIRGTAQIVSSLERLGKVPQKLYEEFSSPKVWKELASAAPLLALCYMSPTVCAEMKNLQLHFERDLTVQVDACKLIDDTINSKAESVRRAKAESIQACINDKVGPNRNKPKIPLNLATAECTESNQNFMYTDIARGFAGKYSKRDRLVLSEMMASINESNPKKVSFMQSLLGEIKQDSSGEQPMLPPNRVKMTPQYVAKDVRLVAHHSVCDVTRLRSALAGGAPLGVYSNVPQIRYFEEIVGNELRRNLTETQVRDLEDMDKPDRDLVCAAMGKTIAAMSLRTLATELDSSIGTAISNPALEPELAAKYLQRTASATSSLRNEAGEAKEISRLRAIAARIAEVQRSERHATAATFSRGDAAFQRVKLEQASTPCTSVLTCK